MIKLFRYGVTKPPFFLDEEAFKQLKKGNRYWNQLVEIDKRFQEEAVRCMTVTGPGQ
jgi:hypothetical protein